MQPEARSLSISDAIQPLVGSQQQLAMANRRRAVRSAVVSLDHVVGQQFEFWLGRDDERAGVLRDDVKLSVSQDGGRPNAVWLRLQSLLVEGLAGLGVLAADEAAAVAGPI